MQVIVTKFEEKSKPFGGNSNRVADGAYQSESTSWTAREFS
jgi:hypothetical protein